MTGLPDVLIRLDPDSREWALALAAEIVRRDLAPIEGLSPEESRLVRVVHAARGRVVRRIELQEIGARDPADPPVAKVVDVRLWRIARKRPDVRALLETVRGEGVRWRDPSAPIPERAS